MSKLFPLSACIMLLCAGAAAQERSWIVEEGVARVNNDIITRSEYQRARAQVSEEARQGCANCTPDELQERVAAKEKDLLRDMIDTLLLVQRGKDLGLNVESDVVRRLDDIRQENKIPSMEALQQRIEESGLNFQDFRETVRDQIYQQEIIRREVGSRILLDQAEVLKYYEEHQQEFVRAEQVVLREIFITTEDKPEAEIPALRKKADDLLQRVKGGEDFGELARSYSEGSTATEGGDLGTFQRGQLAPNLEEMVFEMDRGQFTDVIPAEAGLLILQVREHYTAGLQPEEKVENEIMARLYDAKIGPALREYLTKLRQDSYIDVKSGYVDTSSVPGMEIEEEPATPE